MGKTILIVDDSRVVRQQVSILFTQAGYSVIEAADGREGLKKITAQRDIAVVICDLHMPEMNGIEMMKAVRAAGIATLPIIMLTTEGQGDVVAQAKQAGASGWMVKPFNQEKLLAAVKTIAGVP